MAEHSKREQGKNSSRQQSAPRSSTPKDTRRQAQALLKYTSQLLRRHGRKLSPEVLTKIESAQAELSKVIADGDTQSTIDRGNALQSMVEQHLPHKKRKSAAREYAESILIAILAALFLRAFVVEAFKIPSGSMIPTLQVGDHIFVNKFSYGLRMPFTRWYFVQFDQPERGDVVVFMYPKDPETDFIKRVIGIPGDTVTVRNGMVTVVDENGKTVAIERVPLEEDYLYQDNNPALPGSQIRTSQYTEVIGGKEHTVIQRKDGYHSRDVGPLRVQPGHLFVLGDNRDNSHDSRYWGQVPLENVKGRALIVWWSTNDTGRIGTVIR